MTRETTTKTPRRVPWGMLLLGLIVGGAGALLLTVFVGMPLALGHRGELPLERLYANVAVEIAVGTQAGSAANPVANNARAAEVGRQSFTGSCAVCHGANGDGKGAFGLGLYPPASDLRAQDTQEKSDAKLFWIVKNGLSFAGMPSFGSQYDDQSIWSMVSYIRTLGSGSAQSTGSAPAATAEQLAQANPQGTPAQRGAAVFFAMGCDKCHGAVGNASGDLRLGGRARNVAQTVRRGERGMPTYGPDLLSEAQLADLTAYVSTFTGGGGFGR